MGGLTGLVDSFLGTSGAEAASAAGTLQADAFKDAIPGIESAVSEAQIGLDPYSEAGVRSLEQYQALMGLLGPEAAEKAVGNIQESPSQKFIRQRQERALKRNAAATGSLGGGNVQTALQEQAAGFASQDLENQYRRLAGLTDIGFRAEGTSGDIGIRGAETVGRLSTSAAEAAASGTLGAAQSRASGASNLVNVGLTAALLSDKNKKTDIHDLDLKACYDAVMDMPLKSWRYLEETGLDQGVNFGPMSQDAPDMIKIEGSEMLDIHNELMMIAGALQYMKNMRLN